MLSVSPIPYTMKVTHFLALEKQKPQHPHCTRHSNVSIPINIPPVPTTKSPTMSTKENCICIMIVVVVVIQIKSLYKQEKKDK